MIKHASKNGGILGAISIILTLVIYIVDPTFLANWWIGFVFLFLNLILVVYLGIGYRKEIGGYISFGHAWQYSIVAFAVGGLVSTLFMILLYTVIDPGVKEIIIEASLENTEKMMRSFGTPDEAIDEALENARSSTEDALTPFGIIKNYFIAMIIYAIISLITGAIIKKNKPEFE